MAKMATKTLLKHVRTVPVPVQTTVTDEEYFQEAGVVSMGFNFKAQFLGLEIGTTELVELTIHELTESSLDAPILAELGDKAELTVFQFKTFLAANRKSQEWFVLYLKGKDGNLWAVCASWSADSDGWNVYASSVDVPDRGDAVDRGVSRN